MLMQYIYVAMFQNLEVQKKKMRYNIIVKVIMALKTFFACFLESKVLYTYKVVY
jgi:hypothetical protein